MGNYVPSRRARGYLDVAFLSDEELAHVYRQQAPITVDLDRIRIKKKPGLWKLWLDVLGIRRLKPGEWH